MKSSSKGAINDNALKGKCPTCAARSATDYQPFCSKRCADIDLHRWLSGAYAIPAVESDSDPESEDDRPG